MSQFTMRRLGGEDKRQLDRLAAEARARTPLFSGGDNGIEAPVASRRQFMRTASGVVVVSFLPVWSLPAAPGCAGGTEVVVGLLITLFNVAKEVFNLGDPADPIAGMMGFDNRTGGPLNLQVLLELLDIDRDSIPDEVQRLLEMAIDEAPTYEWSGLQAQDEGAHKSAVTALGEEDETDTFQIKKIS